jgi:hypothetical protein
MGCEKTPVNFKRFVEKDSPCIGIDAVKLQSKFDWGIIDCSGRMGTSYQIKTLSVLCESYNYIGTLANHV